MLREMSQNSAVCLLAINQTVRNLATVLGTRMVAQNKRNQMENARIIWKIYDVCWLFSVPPFCFYFFVYFGHYKFKVLRLRLAACCLSKENLKYKRIFRKR